jgi:hypothetical protein
MAFLPRDDISIYDFFIMGVISKVTNGERYNFEAGGAHGFC